MIFPFPVIPGNNNVSFPFPKFGIGISIPVPVPKKLGMEFSFPFPFPKVGNAIFHSRSRSQSLGLGWAIPVPKCQKVIPAHPWVSEGSKMPNLYFGKVFFQLACRIILGPPKHVLHLVWSCLNIYLALKTTLKVSLNRYLSPFMLAILDNYDQK